MLRLVTMSGASLTENILDTEVPEAVALLNRTALLGGKHLRPALCYQIARLLELDPESVKPFAEAAERIHNATLVHDDVIDESKERRGKPTLNATGHNQRAVLAGDLLLASALCEIDRTSNFDIVKSLHRTLLDLVEGEWLQLEARGQIDVDERHLRKVAIKKTGSLLAWCCETPANFSRQDTKLVSALSSFGSHLGLAFQMTDDCLDFSTKSGKPYAQDLREGQINFVTYELLNESPELLERMKDLLGKDFDESLTPWSQTQIDQAIRKVREKSEREIKIALIELESTLTGEGYALESSPTWKKLLELIQWLSRRAN